MLSPDEQHHLNDLQQLQIVLRQSRFEPSDLLPNRLGKEL